MFVSKWTRPLLLIALVLSLAACEIDMTRDRPDSTGPPDSVVGDLLSPDKGRDLGGKDLEPDRPRPDLTGTDLLAADLPQPDLMQPDALVSKDSSTPDMGPVKGMVLAQGGFSTAGHGTSSKNMLLLEGGFETGMRFCASTQNICVVGGGITP